MTINVTPIPKLTVLAAPAFTLGTTNVAGDALTSIASNSTILAYDATVSSTLAFGGSANTGSATVSSRRDHSHGMPADPATAEASQAQMEAASVGTVYASPRRAQYHPGVAKAVCTVVGGSLSSGSYGVDAASNDSTGVYTVEWLTDFDNALYTTSMTVAAGASRMGTVDNPAVGQINCKTYLGNGTADNNNFQIAAFGTQS